MFWRRKKEVKIIQSELPPRQILDTMLLQEADRIALMGITEFKFELRTGEDSHTVDISGVMNVRDMYGKLASQSFKIISTSKTNEPKTA